MGTEASEARQVTCGTPQGSCILCLIFILYTSDAEERVDHGILQMYANDSFLTVFAATEEELKIILEWEGLKVLKFLASNKLIANASKTDLLIIRPKMSDLYMRIVVAGTEIEESMKTKILGVTITSDLKWKTHRTNLKRDLHYRIEGLQD